MDRKQIRIIQNTGTVVRRKADLLVLLFFLMLFACKSEKNEKDASNSETENTTETAESVDSSNALDFVCTYDLGSAFLTEKYALYHDNQERLQIFDVVSGTDQVFCFDPGCEHEPSQKTITGEIIKMGCIAYEFSNQNVMLQGDTCFFADTFSGEVFSSDRQGENRRLIGRIPSSIQVHQVFFSKDALFGIYTSGYEMIEVKGSNGESRWLVGSAKDKDTSGLVRIDLSDGTYTEIFSQEKYSARVFAPDIRGDHLYFEFYYTEMPYMGLNGETYGREIPVEYKNLSVEEYRAKAQDSMRMDIYDYNMMTGELNCILKQELIANVAFCKDFFATSQAGSGKTSLYRYNGECFRELNIGMHSGIRSDAHLVCRLEDAEGVCVMVDENTGEELKRVTLKNGTITPEVIIGESCYGLVSKNGGWGAGYISAEDFWNGDFSKAIAFKVR